jgi:6,7-dimethyl-8-ribityllumazine synthase
MSGIDEPDGPSGERSWAPESGEDLERASENVLDGWPAPSTTGTDADGEPEEPAQTDEIDVEAAVGAEPEGDALPDALDETVVEPVPTATAIEEPLHGEVVETSSEHAPGELIVPPGYAVLEGQPQGRRRAVGIVVSRFNGEVTGALLSSALDELGARGVGPDSITVMPVPGAFELPIAAMALAKTRRFACVVALGCVIRGDTPHFDYVASEAASGLQLAAIETGVPVSFGVLTLDRPDQAEPRFSKGAEAVVTALEMADLFANLRAAAAR